LFFDERIFEQRIDLTPQFRGVGDAIEIGLAGQGVERTVAVGEEVEHLGARVFVDQFDGIAQVPGGGVVTIAEPGREDQNLFHTITLNRVCYTQVTNR